MAPYLCIHMLDAYRHHSGHPFFFFFSYYHFVFCMCFCHCWTKLNTIVLCCLCLSLLRVAMAVYLYYSIFVRLFLDMSLLKMIWERCVYHNFIEPSFPNQVNSKISKMYAKFTQNERQMAEWYETSAWTLYPCITDTAERQPHSSQTYRQILKNANA